MRNDSPSWLELKVQSGKKEDHHIINNLATMVLLFQIILLDDTEEIDVCVVEGEVKTDVSGSPSNPKSLSQLFDDGQGLIADFPEILD